MAIYKCERCENEFEPDLTTYHAYFPVGYSEILRKEKAGRYEPDRLIFVQADFYTVATPHMGVKGTLYLCPNCKFILKEKLKEFFCQEG
jgi:DNA-directed RNA polymerase subunit RPC12/RpoP